MYTKKLGIEVGCCTRSMSKKGDGKSGESINSRKNSSIQSKEISPKSKSNNTENIVEKIRPSTPTTRKKSVSCSANQTGANSATDSPGPLTRGKKKSLSVRSSIRNISDYFEKEQPKDCDEINNTTDKKVDVEKSGIDKKTAVLSDNKHVINSSDLTKKTSYCKDICVVLCRTSEKILAEYNNLEYNKGSKKSTNEDKSCTHNTSKQSLENMADNITGSDDNNDTAKKSSNDLKSENSSNKDISENNDMIISLKKKNSLNNSINSEDVKPLSSSDSNLSAKKEKVGFEMKKTDENIERVDNLKETSSSFSPKQSDNDKTKINEQIESSIKKTDIVKPTTPSVKKELESPEKLSPATCTGETSIKNVEKSSLGRKVEKPEILKLKVIKTERLTRNSVGNEREEHVSKGKFCDDSDNIISPQEFLKDVFNKAEDNLLENKKTALSDSDKNENRLSAVTEKKRDESKVVDNVEETTKSKSSSINIESEECVTKNKTEITVAVIENGKPIKNSESTTNICEDKTRKLEKKTLMMKPDKADKEKEKQLQENQEAGAEKKDDDTVSNEGSSPRAHAEIQTLPKNKRKSTETTFSESVVSQNKPSKSNANLCDNSQQLVITSITTDSVPEAKRLPSPGNDVAAVESSPQRKQLEKLKDTGKTMIEADNISISDKKNKKTPNKQSPAREGVEVDIGVVEVQSSEPGDKTIDSRKDEVEKDSERKGAEDENIALEKTFLKAEAEEGDGICKCYDSELKETGETMIEADNTFISDKKNKKTPSKQSTVGHTNESSSVEENKVVSDTAANDLESHERMSENESEKERSESSISSPNRSVRIIDLQEDSRMSGVEEIPEVVIKKQSVVDNKDKHFSAESNCEKVGTTASGNEHSEVIDVIGDIPINVNKSRTFGKRSFDDENDTAGNEEQSLRYFRKKKKVKCIEKEDEKNTSREDNDVGSWQVDDENIVTGRNENGEEGTKSEQDKDIGGSLNIDDKDIPPTIASLVKPAEEGVQDVSEVVDVQSSESGDKTIDTKEDEDEPEQDEVVKDSEREGAEDENIVLEKTFLDAEVEEGDGICEFSDFESKDIGSQKNILDEAEGENIGKVMVDESSDSDSSNIVSVKVFLDEADKSKEEIVDDVIDEGNDESDGSDIVSGNNFLDDEGKEDEDDESDSVDDREILSVKDFLDDEAEEGDEEIEGDTGDESDHNGDDDIIGKYFLDDEGKEDGDDESDSVDDREILSVKDFLDDEAEEGDEEIEGDTDDESDHTGDDDIIGKYFLDDESDEDEEKNDLKEISEEYSKTNVKNTVLEVNILEDKARKTKEEVKIEKKKVKDIAENRNGNEVLRNISGETVSNDEMISPDKSEKSGSKTVLKTKISRSDETKLMNHSNNKGSWIVSSIKDSSKIHTFNNKICTNNVKFVATDIDSDKISLGERNLSLNNHLNWSICTVKEDKDVPNSKKKPLKLNQLKRRLENVTKKERSSVSSSILLPSTKHDQLVVQENPDLYDSLLLKRKRSKKKSKENKVEEDSIEELPECFGSSATLEGTKSLSIPFTSGETKESIKNTLTLKHSKDEDNMPEMHNLDEQNEEVRISMKRFPESIEIYKKKLKVTHNTDKVDKHSLRNTNETPTVVEIKKCPFRITVGNLPKSASPNELKSTFSQIGCTDIVSVSPIMDSVEMKFSFVTFASRSSQQRALEYYGQLFLKGNPLFPIQCHQDDHVSEERDTHKSNQNPTPEPQKYGETQTKYNRLGKNENHGINKSKLATDMSGESQNRNIGKSTNHLSKQKSVIEKNSKSNMNKTYNAKKLNQKQTKWKNDVVHLSKSEENAAAARKISGNTDLTTKMGGSQCNSVNIKYLGKIRPTIKDVKEAFSVVGVTDVNCINQMSKNVTSVELASIESVEKVLSYSGKMVIKGVPVLINQKNALQGSLDFPGISTAPLENKKVKILKQQLNVKTVIDKEQNSDTAVQNRPKVFSLIMTNLPTNSSITNIKKSLLNCGIKGICKVILIRDENDNKDKLTGVVKFNNEKFYLNALNTKNILVNGSHVKFITKKD